MSVFRRQPFEDQERGLRSALGAIAKADPHEIAASYLRREDGQAYVVAARRDGASAVVLDIIRAKLRERRAK